ncbi:MAG: hypothetical protein Fur0040_11410 [Sideroxydans sp.]
MPPRNEMQPSLRTQQGAAFIVMLVILVMGITALFVSSLDSAALRNLRNEKTSEALATARDALQGYALRNAKRPGALPCPDTNNDGVAEGSCAGANLLGRLPWKTLGLPELRDGYNETLWYALAPEFVNSGSSLNSDTSGALSLSGSSNLTALVFSAGAVLPNQQRDANNMICPLDGASRPANRCASNYLEGENQDNDYVFVRAPQTDTFNDVVLELKAETLLPAVEQRIAREVVACLKDYAASNPWGRFPWSTKLDGGSSPSYNDKSDERFGRLPDDLSNTRSDSSGTMPDVWPSTEACNGIFPTTSGWWNNSKWKELVFYAVTSRYKPKDSTPSSCGTSSCLSVNPPSADYDKKVVVIVAGKKLAGQNRSSNADKANLSNYLEGNNATAATTKIFEQGTQSATFNDTVLFIQ